MPSKVREKSVNVNVAFDPSVMAEIDLYGEHLMRSVYNPKTRRGRSAVIRTLVRKALDAEAQKLGAAITVARRAGKGKLD